MDEMMGWAEELEVVVCGFGGAGTAAAIEAHDQGARVLVVEKSLEGGGSTAESGGSIPTILDRDRHVVGRTRTGSNRYRCLSPSRRTIPLSFGAPMEYNL